MTEVLFFLSAIVAIAGAIGVIALKNPFNSVLSLVVHLVALAMLFLLLHSEFIAAAQVVVYAGAVMVLYVFVVGYVGGLEAGLAGRSGPALRVISVLFAFVLFIELSIALIGTGLEALNTEGAPYVAGFGEPAEIGRLFLTDYLVAFEVASLLLLVAAIGAVILARRRSGLGDPREVSVTEFLGRDELTKGKGETGTMVEAGGPRDI